MSEFTEEHMEATPEDRLLTAAPQRKIPWLPIAIGLLVLAVIVWWLRAGDSDPSESMDTAIDKSLDIVAPKPLPRAVDIPDPYANRALEEPVELESEGPAAVALPALSESDEEVRQQWTAAGADSQFDQFLRSNNLIQQFVVLLDGTNRGLILRKKLPLPAPSAKFSAIQDGDKIWMDTAGYSRYDSFVAGILQLSTDTLVDHFHRYRPLYEQAYQQLGLDPDDLDNAVIRSLDRVIATPVIRAPIELERKSVMYSYADPKLEKLAPLQKQLLRMGPENSLRLIQKAAELRRGLLDKPQ